MARADVIVIGLGAMGGAACRSLAARGASVLGIDRFSPPHDLGSTHGDTRITRLAIGEGQEYVPLARRSRELWRELERETGADLLTQAGVLILGPPSSRFLRETRLAARQYGIEHEDLTGAQIAPRYPMLALGEQTETEAYFEPEAGFLRPEAAVAAQLRLARRDGAQLRLGERVLRWSASADGVSVTT
ncbi:MAG: FAD-dependent oxidoreductase, partial [Solirubrobacteraceae bacterium]